VFAISGVTGSVLGREMGWKFVKDNWDKLYGRYQGGFLLARLTKVGAILDRKSYMSCHSISTVIT